MQGVPGGIVTGASRGLGLALARALAERGWDLVIDARGEQALAGAAESRREGAMRGGDPDANGRAVSAASPGGRVTSIAGDVADPAHREALVEAAGVRIDLLVNNASLLAPSP